MLASATERKQTIDRILLVVMALAALAGDLGCSHLKSRRHRGDQDAPVLGSELPSRDIYAGRAPAGAEPPPILTVDPLDRPEPGSSDDLLATPVAISERLSAEPVVKLQLPVMINPARVGSVATNAGVPDGARLIAAARLDPLPFRPIPSPTSRIVTEARAALDGLATYQLKLRRQERVNGTLLPPEDLVMSIRRQPKAARLTWVDGPHRGREVLYRSDEPGGLMHVNMADSKFPVPRLSLAPDNPMVMKNSRHPITEAGLDPLVASMEQAEKSGSLTDLGLQTPPPLDHPHQGVLQKTDSGEVWRAYFDPATHFPAIVECKAGNGDLLEYYLFQEIQPNPAELATVAAFDPDSRWGAPRGLLHRATARANPEQSPESTR